MAPLPVLLISQHENRKSLERQEGIPEAEHEQEVKMQFSKFY